MKTYSYQNNRENAVDAMINLYEIFESYGAQRKFLNDKLTNVRKVLEYVADVYPQDEIIKLEVFNNLGDIRVRIFVRGDELKPKDVVGHFNIVDEEAEEEDVDEVKENDVLVKYFTSGFTCKYNGKLNTITTTIKKSSYRPLFILLIALIGGMIGGVLFTVVLPGSSEQILAKKVLNNISTIFTNCIKTLVGPLMFFTIASAISSYSDLSALGRRGGKLIVKYFRNALIAIVVSTIIVLVMKPGASRELANVTSLVAESGDIEQTVDSSVNSITETLVGFFPSNFFRSFLDSSMMQIIVISLLLGISTGFLPSDARDGVSRFLDNGNKLFCKMVDIVMIFLPISVFCSMSSMVILLGAETLLMLFEWLLALIIAFFVMAAIYILFIAVSAKISPLLFLKRYGQAIISTFEMGSCNSSMPTCISIIEKKMGVSNSVSALTIPIGVSIHCASNCVFYIISLFFLANIYTDTVVSPLAYPMIFFTVLTLGIGAPSISGAGPICVAMLLPSLGVPMGLVNLIMGLDPIVSMFKSAASCIEDASATLTTARAEGMIDDELLSGSN